MVASEVSDHQLVIALQSLRVPDESGPNPLSELREALVRVGLAASSPDLGEEDLLLLADAWVDEYQATVVMRNELEDRRTHLVVEHDAAVVRRDTPEHDGLDPTKALEDALASRVHAAEAAVTEAAARVAQHTAAEGAISDALIRLEQLHAATSDRVAAIDRARALETEVAASLEAARSDQREAEAAAMEAKQALDRAVQDRASLVSNLEDAERTDFEAEIATAEEAIAAAEASRDRVQERLTRAKAIHDDLAEEAAVLRTAANDADAESPPAEEIEWYLLARLAGQRQVSFAGSVPLVIDDALASIDPEGLRHVLDRLERMAGAVQVIHLSDDETIGAWAQAAGEDRVAIVHPTSPRR